jgi:hypothetical protein
VISITVVSDGAHKSMLKRAISPPGRTGNCVDGQTSRVCRRRGPAVSPKPYFELVEPVFEKSAVPNFMTVRRRNAFASAPLGLMASLGMVSTGGAGFSVQTP